MCSKGFCLCTQIQPPPPSLKTHVIGLFIPSRFLSQQPEEPVRRQSRTHTHTHNPASGVIHGLGESTFTSLKAAGHVSEGAHLIYFLRVAADHDGTAARLQMRADGPERQRRRQFKSGAISFISILVIIRNLVGAMTEKLVMSLKHSGGAGSEPPGSAICLKTHHFFISS